MNGQKIPIQDQFLQINYPLENLLLVRKLTNQHIRLIKRNKKLQKLTNSMNLKMKKSDHLQNHFVNSVK